MKAFLKFSIAQNNLNVYLYILSLDSTSSTDSVALHEI
jgi:hypothetical protein